MLALKALRVGCFNCQRLEQEVRAARTELTSEIADDIVQVTAYTGNTACGIGSIPAPAINDRVASAGRIHKREQTVGWVCELKVG
jgi:hypothetical protein